MLGKKVAKNVKKYRKERGLTQKELGELIGKHELSVRKYEAYNNKTTVRLSLELIEDIAEALDIYVYKLMDKPSGLTVGVSIKDTEQFKLLIDIMKDMLTDERINHVVRMEYYQRYLSEVEGEGETIEG